MLKCSSSQSLPRGDWRALLVSGLVTGVSETFKVYGHENTVSQFPVASQFEINSESCTKQFEGSDQDIREMNNC